MRFAGLWLLLGALLVPACQENPQQRSEEVCAAFCDCLHGGFPAEVQACIDNDCLPSIPPVTDACLDCVHSYEATCPDLFNQCDAECLMTATP